MSTAAPSSPEDFVRWLARDVPSDASTEEIIRLARRASMRPINLILPDDEEYGARVLADLERRNEFWDPAGLTVVYTDKGVSPAMQQEANKRKAEGRSVTARTLVRYPADWIKPGSVWRMVRNQQRTAVVVSTDPFSGTVTVRSLQANHMREVSLVNFWRLYMLEYHVLAKFYDLPDGDKL